VRHLARGGARARGRRRGPRIAGARGGVYHGAVGLPSLAEVVGVDAGMLRAFMELVLNPISLAIVADAVDLGVFEALTAGVTREVGALAEAVGEDEGSVRVEILAELGAGLGLLERRGGGLALSPMSATFLLDRSPLRLLGLVEHYRGYLIGGASMGDALRGSGRSRRSMWRPGAPREEHERYFAARQGYNESRRGYFTDTAWLLLRAHLGHDLGSRRAVCDVGSGPGAFACLLARSFPGLRALAVDASFAFEEYRRASEVMAASEGAAVDFVAANALLDPLPAGVDLITFNRLLSGVPRDGADAWIERAYAALAPGGVLAAADMFMCGDPRHDRHVAAVVGLWTARDRFLLVNDPPTTAADDKHQWGWSRPWHAEEVAARLRAHGFVDTFAGPADPPFTLVGGVKP